MGLDDAPYWLMAAVASVDFLVVNEAGFHDENLLVLIRWLLQDADRKLGSRRHDRGQ